MNCYESKTEAYGKGVIRIGSDLVFSAKETSVKHFEGRHLHGTGVTLRLLELWFHINLVVCLNSLFASLDTSEALYENGLRFTEFLKAFTARDKILISFQDC